MLVRWGDTSTIFGTCTCIHVQLPTAMLGTDTYYKMAVLQACRYDGFHLEQFPACTSAVVAALSL
jgi:hypothetical protein